MIYVWYFYKQSTINSYHPNVAYIDGVITTSDFLSLRSVIIILVFKERCHVYKPCGC